MQHAFAVGKGDGVAAFAKDVEQFVQRVVAQGGGVLLAQVVEDRLKRAALHQLHRVEKRYAPFPYDVVDGHDVWVGELRQNLGFTLETPLCDFVHFALQKRDLGGNRPAQFEILGFQDRAHASTCNLPSEVVVVAAMQGHHFFPLASF